jgi:tRNA threonylcarbamoyladenosine biosynthesis protein TsaE
MDSVPRESLSVELADAQATERLGCRIAEAVCRLPGHWLITLQGGLGAGKTTLVRGFLKGLGHRGRVPSPTYTLIEPYSAAGRSVLHVDLYRLADPEELEYLGFRELFTGDAIVLVEWPERAGSDLPEPDLLIRLQIKGAGRIAVVRAISERARALLRDLGGEAG